MAFVGKKVNEAAVKKPIVTVSMNNGRVGCVFRKGVVAPGTSIDVLIGVDEDYGYLLVKRGTGSPVSKFGNSDHVVSWGASRKASVVYPLLNRVPAEIIRDDADGILLKLPVDAVIEHQTELELGL